MKNLKRFRDSTGKYKFIYYVGLRGFEQPVITESGGDSKEHREERRRKINEESNDIRSELFRIGNGKLDEKGESKRKLKLKRLKQLKEETKKIEAIEKDITKTKIERTRREARELKGKEGGVKSEIKVESKEQKKVLAKLKPTTEVEKNKPADKDGENSTGTESNYVSTSVVDKTASEDFNEQETKRKVAKEKVKKEAQELAKKNLKGLEGSEDYKALDALGGLENVDTEIDAGNGGGVRDKEELQANLKKTAKEVKEKTIQNVKGIVDELKVSDYWEKDDKGKMTGKGSYKKWGKTLASKVLGIDNPTESQQEAVVKTLQKEMGVKVDGKFGPKTHEAFFKRQNKESLTAISGDKDLSENMKKPEFMKKLAAAKTPEARNKILASGLGNEELKAKVAASPGLQKALVKQLQKNFNEGKEKKDHIPVDGIYGKKTVKALGGGEEKEGLSKSEKMAKGQNLKFSSLKSDELKPFKSKRIKKLPEGVILREGKFGAGKSLDFPKEGIVITGVTKAEGKDIYSINFGDNKYVGMTKEQLNNLKGGLESKKAK